ncbi:hypothetical protein ACWGID_15005 [Kribbella sp. NPDC054772]
MDEADDAIQVARTTVAIAVRRLRGYGYGFGSRPVRSESEQFAADRFELEVVMRQVEAEVQPILEQLAGLAAQDPEDSSDLRVALGAILQARETARLPFTRDVRSESTELLGLAHEYLDAYVRQRVERPDRPANDTTAEAQDLSDRIGARPPGPWFLETDKLSARGSAFAESVAAQQRDGEVPAGRADEIPGPYDNLREPWFRAALRRVRRSARNG